MSSKKWCDSGIPLVTMDCLEASLKMYGGIWWRTSSRPRFYNKAWVYSQQYRYLLVCLARRYFTYPRPTAWDIKRMFDMRTPIGALKEIRDRLTYFCLRTDGKYDPPWATELVGIIDDILKYKKNTDNPFYVDIGTSVVAIRCSSNHDVVHRLDHAYSKGSIDYLEQMCARMNEEALGLQKHVNAAAMREALEFIKLASDDYEKYGNTKAGALDVIYEKACAALADPPRNCDVGTAEEQERRYKATGEVYHTLTLTNALAWAQMPYEAERKGEADGSM